MTLKPPTRPNFRLGKRTQANNVRAFNAAELIGYVFNTDEMEQTGKYSVFTQYDHQCIADNVLAFIEDSITSGRDLSAAAGTITNSQNHLLLLLNRILKVSHRNCQQEQYQTAHFLKNHHVLTKFSKS